jgi:hypothetical protein
VASRTAMSWICFMVFVSCYEVRKIARPAGGHLR